MGVDDDRCIDGRINERMNERTNRDIDIFLESDVGLSFIDLSR